ALVCASRLTPLYGAIPTPPRRAGGRPGRPRRSRRTPAPPGPAPRPPRRTPGCRPPATSSRAPSAPSPSPSPSCSGCATTPGRRSPAPSAASRTPARTTAGRSASAAPRRPSRSPEWWRPAAARSPARPRHQPLLDEVQHPVRLQRRAFRVEPVRPVERDAGPGPVHAQRDEPDLAHHGVAGLVPELARHVAVVAPRLARRPGDDRGHHLRHVDLAQPLVEHHEGLGAGRE